MKPPSTKPIKTTIPYGKQHLSDEDIARVVSVLKSDFLTQGPVVSEFETALANHCGSRFAVTFSSGTAALHAACHVAGLRKNDHAITSPISFLASANCALYCQANVSFADVSPKTAQVSFETIEKHITEKTKVIIPVDLAGRPADTKELFDWANDNQRIIIRDAAHSLGGSYVVGDKTYNAGSCKHAHMACLSFHPVKSITTGEGGAVTTNDPNFYKKLMAFRHHGITKNPQDMVHQDKSSLLWYHEMQDLGLNYRLSDIHCALGLSQMQKLDGFVSKRRELVGHYKELLNDSVTFLSSDDDHHSSAHHILPVLVSPEKRDALMNHLFEKGIRTQLHYIPIYRQPYYQENFDFSPKNYPHSEDYFAQALSLPLFFDLERKDVEQICSKIKEGLS